MIKYYKTIGVNTVELEELTEDCWIHVVDPTIEEQEFLIKEIKIEENFIKQSLDEEESPHIDYDDDSDQTLIVVDYPLMAKLESKKQNKHKYITSPLGFVFAKKKIITITKRYIDFLDIEKMDKKNLVTEHKTKFFLQIMLRISQKFLLYLRHIDKLTNETEAKLHKSMQNKELIQMLTLEKSLVYFSTSLKTDEVILNKIMKGKNIKLYEEDEDLIEDVLIEFHQAIEMSTIYTNILSGTMDAFASVISNNLDIVMKLLTVITIVMSIPEMVFSFYGMNIGKDSQIPGSQYWWIPLIISAIICTILTWFLTRRRKMK